MGDGWKEGPLAQGAAGVRGFGWRRCGLRLRVSPVHVARRSIGWSQQKLTPPKRLVAAVSRRAQRRRCTVRQLLGRPLRAVVRALALQRKLGDREAPRRLRHFSRAALSPLVAIANLGRTACTRRARGARIKERGARREFRSSQHRNMKRVRVSVRV